MEKPARSNLIVRLFNLLNNPATFSISPRVVAAGAAPPNKPFAGPLVPIETRRRAWDWSFIGREPVSPHVSCMGKIKHKKTARWRKSSVHPPPPHAAKEKEKKTGSKVKKEAKQKGKAEEKQKTVMNPSAAIGEMKRFASGRQTLAQFDWREAPETLPPAPAPAVEEKGCTTIVRVKVK